MGILLKEISGDPDDEFDKTSYGCNLNLVIRGDDVTTSLIFAVAFSYSQLR